MEHTSALDRLEKEVMFLDAKQEYSIVGTLEDVFDNNGVWGKYTVPEKPMKNDFYWNSPFIHPTIMIRKNAYETVNGYRISQETRRCEDIDLFMMMYVAGFKGYNIQEKLYSYRKVSAYEI